MNSLISNLRIVFRDLRHRPTFVAAVVCTLAIGIGATTAGFALVDAVFLTRLPVRYQNELVLITATPPARWAGSGLHWPLPWQTQELLQERKRAFVSVAAFLGGVYQHTALFGDRTLHIDAVDVSGRFFPVLGVEPALGRLIEANDDVPGGPSVVVLTYQLWRTGFGGDPAVIGRTLFFSGQSHRVIGVAPPEFSYPAGVSVWVPVVQETVARIGHAADYYGTGFYFVGRLRPGVQLSAARSEVDDVLRNYTPTVRDTMGVGAMPAGAAVDRYADEVLGNWVKPAVLVLFGAVALVLVIACTNVAGLLVARGLARAGELSIRAALGAGPAELAALLLSEAALMAIVGGVLGIGTAVALLKAVVALAPPALPMVGAARIDLGVLAFAGAITTLSVLGFGLVPALRGAREHVSDISRASSRGSTSSRSVGVARRVLVAAQVALALVVLSGAGLLGHTLLALQRTSLGFDPSHLLLFRVDQMVPASPGRDTSAIWQARWRALIDALPERIQATPGLGPVTTTIWPPFSGEGGGYLYTVDGRLPSTGQTPLTHVDNSLDDYFGVMGIPLLQGRTLTPHDDRHAPPVVVVNETFARRTWPGQSALGHRVRFVSDSVDRWWTVVGVVGDTHYSDIAGPPQPVAYVPTRQGPWNGPWDVVRTRGDPALATGQLAQVITATDPAYTLGESFTGPALLKTRLARPRALTALFAALAATALFLAALGLFGVLSAYVRERQREMAVRSALGATPAQLRSLVLTQTLAVGVAGTVCGIPLAAGASRVIRAMVSDVRPADIGTLLVIGALLLLVVALATYGPMVRATRVDARAALATD